METGMNELAAQLRLGEQVAREQAACPDEPTEEVEARVVARVADDEARRQATLDAGGGATPGARSALEEGAEDEAAPGRWQEESERRQDRRKW